VLIREVSIPPDLTATANPDTICIDDTFDLTVDFTGDPSDYNFMWAPSECIVSGIDSLNAIGTAKESKTFQVVMTHIGTGIDTVLNVDIVVEDPQVSIFPDNGHPDQAGEPMVCLGSDITLSANPDDPDCSYTWSTGDTGPQVIVLPEENTTYTLTCITSLGCEGSSSVDIEVIPPQCNGDDVFLPNAFSPNSDGVNDVLYVRSKFIRDMEFFVVDRWGEEVFRTLDQDQGWDGRFKGKELAPDVYAYCLKVTCSNGTEYVKSGNVSLLK